MHHFKTVGIVFFCVLFLLPTCLLADIGETVSKAKEKSSIYKKKYGAINPFFKKNKKGLVVAECWNAPSKMWDKKTAMKLAMELVPSKMSKKKPKKIDANEIEEIFKLPDGTKIIFTMMGEKCILVGVYASDYKGPTC